MIERFKIDVEAGLSSSPKYLSSKYFYDKRGDELFVRIMNMPEYYLTDCEFEIFSTQTEKLAHSFGHSSEDYFELIELGAGDGTKTIELLKHLITHGYKFRYIPIDISENALLGLQNKLKTELPNLEIKPRQGDYFKVLHDINLSDAPKIVLFLGSNIGNMTDEQAHDFMVHLSDNLNSNDKVVLGLDLIKSADIVLPAYNDSSGITKAFNFNLLHRINRELGGDFIVENFDHAPEYNEEEGIARSYLISKTEQTVHIEKLGRSFSFDRGERMQLEVSRKYNDAIVHNIIESSGLQISGKLMDEKEYFADYILVKQ